MAYPANQPVSRLCPVVIDPRTNYTWLLKSITRHLLALAGMAMSFPSSRLRGAGQSGENVFFPSGGTHADISSRVAEQGSHYGEMFVPTRDD
jgi:hypothetical protein